MCVCVSVCVHVYIHTHIHAYIYCTHTYCVSSKVFIKIIKSFYFDNFIFNLNYFQPHIKNT